MLHSSFITMFCQLKSGGAKTKVSGAGESCISMADCAMTFSFDSVVSCDLPSCSCFDHLWLSACSSSSPNQFRSWSHPRYQNRLRSWIHRRPNHQGHEDAFDGQFHHFENTSHSISYRI